MRVNGRVNVHLLQWKQLMEMNGAKFRLLLAVLLINHNGLIKSLIRSGMLSHAVVPGEFD